MKLIGPRFQIEGNYASTRNTALCVQTAGRGLQLLNRLHAGTRFQRITRYVRGGRRAIDGIVFGEPLTAVDCGSVGRADRRIPRRNGDGKVFSKSSAVVDAERQ